MQPPYADRVQKFKLELAKRGLRSAILVAWESLFYMTGLQSMQARNRLLDPMPLVVLPEGEPVFVPNMSFYSAAEAEHAPVSAIEPYASPWDAVKTKGIWDVVAKWIKDKAQGEKTIGIELAALTTAHFNELTKIMEGFEFVDCSDILPLMRAVKDEYELAVLKFAGKVSGRVMEDIPRKGILKAGRTEMDAAREVVRLAIEYGAEITNIYPQVTSGPRIKLLGNLVPSVSKRLKHGEVVLVDFGIVYRGYNTDVTGAYVIGRCTKEQRDLEEKVQSIVYATLDKMTVGTPASEAHQAALRKFEDVGYGGHCKHYSGHGIGLSVWDQPKLVEYDHTLLQPKMTFAVEQGIYLDKFGIRLEHCIAITPKGHSDLLGNKYRTLKLLEA